MQTQPDNPTIVPAACSPCVPTPYCENPFDRVVVSYLVRGGSRIAWELRPDFLDAMPYTFQLQVGQTTSGDADDWTDVGAAVTDQFTATDGEQRVYDKGRHQFYRIKLTTEAGTYHSEPAGLWGTLQGRDWRLAREAYRQAVVKMRKGSGGQQGFLLKRRVTGEPCPTCIDYATQAPTQPDCPSCTGTGFRCGYFFPVACVWAMLEPRTTHLRLDGTRGTVNDVVVSARMLNVAMLSSGDVWVNRTTDDRYYVHEVQNVAEVRGVPIVANVKLRLAAATDPIYALPVFDAMSEDELAMEF